MRAALYPILFRRTLLSRVFEALSHYTDAALYDPSDLTSIYQSRTGGSTGAVDSVVGIMLDKSEMGGKTAAAFIAGQSELVTAGSWLMSLSGGATATATESPAGSLNLTGDGVDSARGDQSFTTVSGDWYRLVFTNTGNTVAVSVGPTQGASSIVNTTAATGTTSTILFRATSTTTWVRFLRSGASLTVVSAISVKSLPGYHALAPSDAARPILRAGYVDCDGTDDWMQVFPTLNLGEQWWHVGGWQADTTSLMRPFATSNGNGAPRFNFSADRWEWFNSSSAWVAIASGDPELAHVFTVQQTATAALMARYNGGGSSGEIIPFDDSGSTQTLALFSSSSGGYSNGLNGRFYGGAFGTGTLSSSDRAILERYVAGLTGVSL